jgi:hypothetical protein
MKQAPSDISQFFALFKAFSFSGNASAATEGSDKTNGEHTEGDENGIISDVSPPLSPGPTFFHEPLEVLSSTVPTFTAGSPRAEPAHSTALSSTSNESVLSVLTPQQRALASQIAQQLGSIGKEWRELEGARFDQDPHNSVALNQALKV